MFPNFIADPYARAIFSSMALTPTVSTHPLIGSFFPQAQAALAGAIPQGIVPFQAIHGMAAGSPSFATAPQAFGYATQAAAQLAQLANAGSAYPQAWNAFAARSPFTAAYPQFVTVGAGIPVQALI